MAANTSPIFEAAPKSSGAQFTSADASTKKTIATGGTNGTRIDMISCCTNDTSAVNLAFYITTGGVDYYIGNVPLAAGAGYTTVARVDAISYLAPTLGYLVLASGESLKANCVATMTAAKTTDVAAMQGDY